MNTTKLSLIAGACVLTFAAVAASCRPVVAQPTPGEAPPPPEPGAEQARFDDEDAAEHLLRGPLHEAFAEPVNFNPQPGIVVPKAPPDPVEEVPPEVKPTAEAIWIPGYWAWDEEREDFLWVSGVWRVPPPDQRWVPGYWDDVENGFQWISGLWTSADTQEVGYLPQPPESLERGPSSPLPSQNHFWVNGCWEYQGGRYVWRSGYWAQGHDGWVWVPAHYTWTPHGCVYVPGYWDYRLVDRGMCFAPVYWRHPVYTRPGYYYRPYHVVDLARLHLHLFVSPRYCHYYYGDWYGSHPHRSIYASFNFHGRYGYDPLWTYNHWYFGRQGIDYADRVRGWHRYFEHHKDHRPPHTWKAQQHFVKQNRGFEHLKQVVFGEELGEIASKQPQKVERIGEDVRQRIQENAKEFRKLSDLRRGGEVKAPAQAADAARQQLRLPETSDVRQMRERIAERVQKGQAGQGGQGPFPGLGRLQSQPGDSPAETAPGKAQPESRLRQTLPGVGQGQQGAKQPVPRFEGRRLQIPGGRTVPSVPGAGSGSEQPGRTISPDQLKGRLNLPGRGQPQGKASPPGFPQSLERSTVPGKDLQGPRFRRPQVDGPQPGGQGIGPAQGPLDQLRRGPLGNINPGGGPKGDGNRSGGFGRGGGRKGK